MTKYKFNSKFAEVDAFQLTKQNQYREKMYPDWLYEAWWIGEQTAGYGTQGAFYRSDANYGCYIVLKGSAYLNQIEIKKVEIGDWIVMLEKEVLSCWNDWLFRKIFSQIKK